MHGALILEVVGPGELVDWKDLWREKKDFGDSMCGDAGLAPRSQAEPTSASPYIVRLQLGRRCGRARGSAHEGLLPWDGVDDKHAELVSNRLKQCLWAQCKGQTSPLHQPMLPMLCPSCFSTPTLVILIVNCIVAFPGRLFPHGGIGAFRD